MTPPLELRWVWLFLDTPRADAPASWRFWSHVSGRPVTDRRGERAEFATLGAPAGDPWLKLQAVEDGPGGVHLDLDVDDVHAAARTAESLGAIRVGTIGEGVVLLRSPGGLPFCLTTWHGERDLVREGASEQVDQLCVDAPADAHEAEAAFWKALTGWPSCGPGHSGLEALALAPGMPLRILLQRLEEPTGPVRGHVDIACADRDAALARHVAAGAREVRRRPRWSVMEDPVGRTYCLTGRDPQADPGC